MTAEPSVTHQSSRSVDGGVSPRSRRPNLPSPWAQVVRGEPESVSVATSSSPEQVPITESASALTGSGPNQNPAGSPDQTLAAADETQVVGSSDGGNAGGASKKPVWNKPLNGAADTSPVMGADSWPALSESTRPLPKSSPESSSKPTAHDVSMSHPQGPVISHTPHKPAKHNANANNNNHNHGHFARQKSIKRGNSGSSGTAGGGPSGFTRPPPPPTPPPLPPPFPVFEIRYPNLVSPVMDAPVRGEGPFKGNNNWPARPMGDNSSYRNPSRRGNFGGGRPRGDGPYANGYGGRHDQDRDWHGNRGSNARDVHMPPHQMVPPPPRGFIRAPHPGAPPFLAPQPMRPFGSPMGFDMASMPSPYLYVHTLPPETFRGAPLMPHMAPMYYPVMDPPLPTLILNQIDYYFSEANLVKDKFLRKNMDNEAWVSVDLIAQFPRVQSLTNDIQLILDSLRNSTVVEVQGDKVRPRKDWQKWAPTSSKFPADSSEHGESSDSSLPTSFQKLKIDEVPSTSGPSDADSDSVPGSSFGQESSDQSKLTNVEVIAEDCSSNI